jgi:hypothetical protein
MALFLSAQWLATDCTDPLLPPTPQPPLPRANRSVFIRDCRDCKFAVVARQLRMRSCSGCEVALHCRTRPAVEACSRLGFRPFAVPYAGLARQMRACRLSPFANFWSDVVDFTAAAAGARGAAAVAQPPQQGRQQERERPEPSWRLASEEEQGVPAVRGPAERLAAFFAARGEAAGSGSGGPAIGGPSSGGAAGAAEPAVADGSESSIALSIASDEDAAASEGWSRGQADEAMDVLTPAAPGAEEVPPCGSPKSSTGGSACAGGTGSCNNAPASKAWQLPDEVLWLLQAVDEDPGGADALAALWTRGSGGPAELQARAGAAERAGYLFLLFPADCPRPPLQQLAARLAAPLGCGWELARANEAAVSAAEFRQMAAAAGWRGSAADGKRFVAAGADAKRRRRDKAGGAAGSAAAAPACVGLEVSRVCPESSSTEGVERCSGCTEAEKELLRVAQALGALASTAPAAGRVFRFAGIGG